MPLSLPNCPTWYGLRGLGRSPISRLTILIPIFGSFILFSSAVNDLVSLSAEFMGMDPDEAISISRRNSFFLYFGLIIFSLSTLAYNSLCPTIVKEFSTEYDYFEAEMQIITQNRAQGFQDELNKNFQADLTYDFNMATDDAQAARALGFQNNTTAESREFWLRAKSQPVADLLQTHYSLENSSRLGLRRTILGAYLVAFVFIAVPSAVTLSKVLTAI